MHHRLASSREMLRLVGESVLGASHERERRRDCTCKRRSIACHVPCAADYRLLLFKNTRNQVDLCRKMLLTHANSDALKGILDFFIT